jgi:hypothetical protein
MMGHEELGPPDGIDRRRMLGWMGAGAALSVLPTGALRADTAETLRTLRWDRALAEANWARRGGPRFVVHDHMAMYWGGGRAVLQRCSPLATPLTATERADIGAALAASTAWYRERGLLWAPVLPQDSEKAFHIFYLDPPEGVIGGTGLGAGDPISDFGIDGYVRQELVKLEILRSKPGELDNKPDTTPRQVPEGNHMMLSGPILRAYRQPPDNDHWWAPMVTIAHEMIHALDAAAPGMSGWGEVKGWCGEGSTHAIPQFSLRRMGYDPLKSYATGVRNVVKDIGLRPYDVTLALTEWPKRVPEFRATELRGQGKKESEQAKIFWEQHATYMTCSFWRFLFEEEAPVRLSGPARRGAPGPTAPGNFELFAPFRALAMTGEDRARAGANSRWIDPVVALLDRFLKARHPVWGVTGLYRAFPAFIAHFVEWPDQIAKSRKGFLAHDKWLGGMFMDGVPLLDIAPGQDIIHEPAIIPPYAARALRFKLPRIEGMAESILGTEYPRVTITVTTLNGPRDAIDHIHLGLRGGVLGNLQSQAIRSGAGRVRRWANIDARALFPGRTNGESVLTIINSAPKPEAGRPIKVRVHIALQVVDASGQCSYHPLPVPGQNGQLVTLPSSVSPPTGRKVPTLAVERGIDDVEITIVQDADLVELVGMAATNGTGSGMEVQRESERGPTGLAAPDPAKIQALAARASNLSTKRGLMITLTLPRVEPGTLGPVSGARVRAEWIDPAYNAFAQFGVSNTVSIATDAVEAVLTTNSEGTLVGTYAANFDAASDNADRIFRGRISGNFSTGVVNDEAREAELPEDKLAIVPTDFFIGAARAGMDTAMISQMMENAGANAEGDTSATPSAGPQPVGSSTLLRNDDATPECPTRSDAELRMALDRYLGEFRKTVPGITAENLRAMRDAMLAAPDTTAQILCDAGF